MKAAVEFNAETRETPGKGAARAARRNGFVPVIVYGKGKDNVSLNVEARALSNEYFRGGFMNKVVALKTGGKNIFAIPRDVQLNPVTDKIEHADFFAVDEKSVVKVWVPVHIVNAEKSVGIKRGGVLNVIAHRVELLAPVASIPASIDVDVAALEINNSVHLKGLKLPQGVTPASKRDMTIASITGRAKEEAEVPVAGAPAAAAVPSTKSAAAGAAAAAAPAAGGKAAPAAKPAAKK